MNKLFVSRSMSPVQAMILSPAKTTLVPTAICRPSEQVVLAYFLYTALLASFRGIAPYRILISWAIPVLILIVLAVETRCTSSWSRFLRHWVPLSLILVGYFQIEFFSAPPLSGLQNTFVSWDGIVLEQFGLQRAVESLGGLIPTALELIYLVLYAVPPAAMLSIYLCQQSQSADRFLFTFFLGTFLAYSLLPHFPTLAPRVVYPEVAPPHYTSLFRAINLYNLNHLDITNSVFPSGHVAVAFSTAFGVLEAIPGRRRIFVSFLLMSILVYTATIYCRYHYAADGFASLLISLSAWRIAHAIRGRKCFLLYEFVPNTSTELGPGG